MTVATAFADVEVQRQTHATTYFAAFSSSFCPISFVVYNMMDYSFVCLVFNNMMASCEGYFLSVQLSVT